MSFNLEPEYDNPIEQAMRDLASLVHQEAPDSYQSDGDGLFAALVRGLTVYVNAWMKSGNGSLGMLLVDTDDLADPDRAGDPTPPS